MSSDEAQVMLTALTVCILLGIMNFGAACLLVEMALRIFGDDEDEE